MNWTPEQRKKWYKLQKPTTELKGIIGMKKQEYEEYEMLKSFNLETIISQNVELCQRRELDSDLRKSCLSQAYLFVDYIEKEKHTKLVAIRQVLDYHKRFVYKR